MGKQAVKVGLIGLGTIGGSVVKLFENNLSNINEKNGLQLVLERVAERDPEKLKSLKIPAEKVLSDAFELVKDPEIDIVIELIGGIEPEGRIGNPVGEGVNQFQRVATVHDHIVAWNGRIQIGFGSGDGRAGRQQGVTGQSRRTGHTDFVPRIQRH